MSPYMIFSGNIEAEGPYRFGLLGGRIWFGSLRSGGAMLTACAWTDLNGS